MLSFLYRVVRRSLNWILGFGTKISTLQSRCANTSTKRRHQYHKSQAADCSVMSYLTHRGMHGRSFSLLGSRIQAADTLYQKDLTAHYGCVNALEFSKCGLYFASGGDDRRVLLWNVCHGVMSEGPTTIPPAAMRAKHNSNIFSLAFTSAADKILSAGNDQMVIVHDAKTGRTLDTYMHEAAVYCVTVSPDNDAIFATASEDGQLQLYDSRTSCDWEDNQLQVSQSHYAFHSVKFHPQQSSLLLSANYKEGVALWDSRNCTGPVLRYGGHRCLVSTMSATFNSIGDTVLALRRRHTPVLYRTRHTAAVAEFDAPHYYNSCTMKSCCFAGDRDQMVLSGSDDFSLYGWKVPDLPQPGESPAVKVTSPNLTLRGHRSIVNQVRYNSVTGLIASAGVGKTVKVWSSLPFPGVPQVTGEARITRRVYTHSQYIRLIMQAATDEPHDYTDGNTDEDPRMMAFFDSLVQREIDGYSFFSDDSLTQSSTETESTEDSGSDDDDDDDASWEKKNGESNSSREPLPLIPARVIQSLVSSDKTRKKMQVRKRGRTASDRWRRATQRRNLRRRIGSYLSLSEVLELCSAVGLDVDNMLDLHRQEVENDDLRAAAAGEDTTDGSGDDRPASGDAIGQISLPGLCSSPERGSNKSRKSRSKSRKSSSTSLEPGTASREPDAASLEPGTASLEPGTASLEPGTASLEPGTASLEPGTASLEPGTSSREPGTSSREPGTASLEPGTSSLEPGTSSREPGSASLEPGPYSSDDSQDDSAPRPSGKAQQTSRVPTTHMRDAPCARRPATDTSSVTEAVDNDCNTCSSGQSGSSGVVEPANNFDVMLTKPGCSSSVYEPVHVSFDPLITGPSCSTSSALKPVVEMASRGRVVYPPSSDDSSSDTDVSHATQRRPTLDFDSCGDSSTDSESPRDGVSCKRKMERNKKMEARKRNKRSRGTYGLRDRSATYMSAHSRTALAGTPLAERGSITMATQQETNTAASHAVAGAGGTRSVGATDATDVVTPEVLNSVTVVTSAHQPSESGSSQNLIDRPTTSIDLPQSSAGSNSNSSSSSSGGSGSSSSSSGGTNSDDHNTSRENRTSPNVTTSTTVTTTAAPSAASSSGIVAEPPNPPNDNPPNAEPRRRYGFSRMPAFGRSNRRAVSSRVSREMATQAIIPTGHRDIADIPISPIRIRSRGNAPAPLGPAPFRRPLFPDEFNIATRANTVQEPRLLRPPGEVPTRALQCGGELYSYDLVLQLIACKRQQREQRRNMRRQDRRMRRYAGRQARRIIEKESKRRAKNQQLFEERRKRRQELFGDEGVTTRNTNAEPEMHSVPSCSSWSTSVAAGSSASYNQGMPLLSAAPSSSILQGHYSTAVGSDGRRSRRGQALAPYTLLDDSDENLNNQQSDGISSDDSENSRLKWLLQSSMRIQPQVKQSAPRIKMSAKRRSAPRGLFGTNGNLSTRGTRNDSVRVIDSASVQSAAPADAVSESALASARPRTPVSPMVTSPPPTPGGVLVTMTESRTLNLVSVSNSFMSSSAISPTSVDSLFPTSSVSTITDFLEESRPTTLSVTPLVDMFDSESSSVMPSSTTTTREDIHQHGETGSGLNDQEAGVDS